MEWIDLLRCPKTGGKLRLDSDAKTVFVEHSDMTYPVIDGIFDFCPGSNGRIAVDVSRNMLVKAKARFQERGVRNVHLLKADAAHLPVRDPAVDMVLSMNAWHASSCCVA